MSSATRGDMYFVNIFTKLASPFKHAKCSNDLPICPLTLTSQLNSVISTINTLCCWCCAATWRGELLSLFLESVSQLYRDTRVLTRPTLPSSQAQCNAVLPSSPLSSMEYPHSCKHCTLCGLVPSGLLTQNLLCMHQRCTLML